MGARAFVLDPIPRKAPFATTMDVEVALSWAYRHELPKLREDGGAWIVSQVHPMWRAGAFGAKIDNWSHEPGFPSDMGPPHEDAMQLAEAAKGLRSPHWMDHVHWPAFDQGLEGFGFDRLALITRAARSVEPLVISRAKLRARPPLPARMTTEPVLGSNGRPTIRRPLDIKRFTLTGSYIEQTDTALEDTRKSRGRSGAYPTGSFCSLRYYPDPRSVLQERVEYLAWWLALNWIAAQVDGLLSSTIVTPPAARLQPWLDDVGI